MLSIENEGEALKSDTKDEKDDPSHYRSSIRRRRRWSIHCVSSAHLTIFLYLCLALPIAQMDYWRRQDKRDVEIDLVMEDPKEASKK